MAELHRVSGVGNAVPYRDDCYRIACSSGVSSVTVSRESSGDLSSVTIKTEVDGDTFALTFTLSRNDSGDITQVEVS